MGLLWLFNSCGYVVGPAIFVAGLLALGLCLRASLKPGNRRARRIALAGSLAPVAVGLCGAAFGLGLLWHLGQLGAMSGENWLNLGKVPLAGLVVAAPALVWSLTLVRLRRGTAYS